MKTLRLIVFLSVITITFGSKCQIFYKIEGNGLEKPSFLFGTHHLAPISVIEDYNVVQYLNEVEQVVGEIDLTQDQMKLAMAMQPYMMAPSDSTLSKILSPEDYELVSKEFKKWAPMPGMELSMLEGMKPNVVTTMVTVKMIADQLPEFDPQKQADTYLQQIAIEQGKKVKGLETPEFQANLLYNYQPIPVQAEELVEMLKSPEEAMDAARKLNEVYLNYDLDGMYSLSQEDKDHPEFMIALLDRRNSDWLNKIPEIINHDASLIVVGALHLAGEKGLVKGLREQGYLVTPLDSK